MNRAHLGLGLAAVSCGLIVAVLLLVPQIRLQRSLGSAWNGHYAATDVDEVAYAAYLETRVQSWPRRSDPYLGLAGDTTEGLPESFLSIQWATPTLAGALARWLGWDTPTLMIWLAPTAGFLTALLLVLLAGRIQRDPWLGFLTGLIVVVGGAAAAGEGALAVLLGTADRASAYPFYPGFRRYIPAGGWPVLVGTIGATFGMWLSRERRAQLLWGALAGVGFAFLVYSYFYLWTTAVAWMTCWALVWWVARPQQRRFALQALASMSVVAAAALFPYRWLLARRHHDIDDVLLLDVTRAPDFLREPVLVGGMAVLLIVLGVRRGLIPSSGPAAMLASSLGLVPLVTLNQQVLTGRSLQPIHYEVFVGNYLALLAVMLAAGEWLRHSGLLGRRTTRAVVVLAALLVSAWGLFEAVITSQPLDRYNARRDQHKPIGEQLAAWVRDDPRARQRHVLVVDSAIGDDRDGRRHGSHFGPATWVTVFISYAMPLGM
jgi:hypothetical protein